MVDFRNLRIDPEATQRRLNEYARRERQKLDRLCAIESGLTDWEVGFVESVARRYERDNFLSDRQWEIVDRILDEKG